MPLPLPAYPNTLCGFVVRYSVLCTIRATIEKFLEYSGTSYELVAGVPKRFHVEIHQRFIEMHFCSRKSTVLIFIDYLYHTDSLNALTYKYHHTIRTPRANRILQYIAMPVILEHQELIDIAVGVGILSASFMITSGLLCVFTTEKFLVAKDNKAKKLRFDRW